MDACLPAPLTPGDGEERPGGQCGRGASWVASWPEPDTSVSGGAEGSQPTESMAMRHPHRRLSPPVVSVTSSPLSTLSKRGPLLVWRKGVLPCVETFCRGSRARTLRSESRLPFRIPTPSPPRQAVRKRSIAAESMVRAEIAILRPGVSYALTISPHELAAATCHQGRARQASHAESLCLLQGGWTTRTSVGFSRPLRRPRSCTWSWSAPLFQANPWPAGSLAEFLSVCGPPGVWTDCEKDHAAASSARVGCADLRQTRTARIGHFRNRVKGPPSRHRWAGQCRQLSSPKWAICLCPHAGVTHAHADRRAGAIPICGLEAGDGTASLGRVSVPAPSSVGRNPGCRAGCVRGVERSRPRRLDAGRGRGRARVPTGRHRSRSASCFSLRLAWAETAGRSVNLSQRRAVDFSQHKSSPRAAIKR